MSRGRHPILDRRPGSKIQERSTGISGGKVIHSVTYLQVGGAQTPILYRTLTLSSRGTIATVEDIGPEHVDGIVADASIIKGAFTMKVMPASADPRKGTRIGMVGIPVDELVLLATRMLVHLLTPPKSIRATSKTALSTCSTLSRYHRRLVSLLR